MKFSFVQRLEDEKEEKAAKPEAEEKQKPQCESKWIT